MTNITQFAAPALLNGEWVILFASADAHALAAQSPGLFTSLVFDAPGGVADEDSDGRAIALWARLPSGEDVEWYRWGGEPF